MTRRRRATVTFVGLLVTFSFVLGQVAYASGPELTAGPAAKQVAPAAAPAAATSLDGGGVMLDFIAAGPYTYDHATGVGGAFNDRTISKGDGVVESLEGGDFACGDRVVFFTAITVEPDAGSGSVELDFTYDGQTTSGAPVGFDDLISATLNAGDTGNENLSGNESVMVNAERFVTTGKDRLETSIQVDGVDAGEQIILRMVVELACDPNPGNVTGNIQSTLDAARVVGGATINSGEQTIPLKQAGDILLPGLNVQKSCPSAVTVGDTITYDITVSNTEQDDLETLVVDDPLLGGPLAGFGSTLAAGESVTRSFRYAVGANPDPVVNTVTVTATGASSNAQVSDVADCTTDVLFPNLSIEKTADASPVSAGDPIGYTITVTNDGEGLAKGVVITDTLPTNGGLEWKVDGGTGAADCEIANGVLTCDFGDLASGVTVTVHISSPTTAETCGVARNSVSVTSSNDGNPSAGPVEIVVNCPNVTVVKTAERGRISAGDTASFTIEISNDGEGTADDVMLEDVLPGGVGWSEDSADCEIANGVLTCDFGDLAPDATRTVIVSGETDASDCGELVNVATVSASNEADDDANDNASEATITVECPGIDIEKTADAQAVDAAETIGFTITVTNGGPGVARDVVVSDTLPTNAGLDWAIDGGTGAEMCAIAQGVLTCGFGDMQAEAIFTIHLSSGTDATTCGLIANTAVVTIGNGEGDEDDAQISVVCPELGIDIEKGGPELAHVGDTVTYTFDVGLTTDEPLFDVVVTDPNCDAGAPTYVSGDDDDFVLEPGEVWSYTCDHLVTEADADPLPNTAVVSGTADDGRTVADEDDHLVDLIHPAIRIRKTVTPDGGVPGDVVTYRFKVTNTGDTTVYDVSVEDDVIGHIGDIEVLEPGQSVTLTRDWELPSEAAEVINIGTATGTDVLGEEVSDDDDAFVTVVEAAGPPPTAFTGSDTFGMGIMAGLLLLLGLAAMGLGRRRRWTAA